MSSGTERRILCYVTDRKGLGAAAGVRARGEARRDVDFVARLLERIRLAIEAGVDWVQIREKDLSGRALMALTRVAVAASAWRARVIVNDRLDVGIASEAGGVHLGGESLPVRKVVAWRDAEKVARPQLADFLVGASCHSVEEARAAEANGANYVIFGPIFETPSKTRFGPPLGIEKLRELCTESRIPVISIGGITESNAGECFRAGATGIAAIRLFQDAASAEEMNARVAALRR